MPLVHSYTGRFSLLPSVIWKYEYQLSSWLITKTATVVVDDSRLASYRQASDTSLPARSESR